jgi:hypothetical protein
VRAETDRAARAVWRSGESEPVLPDKIVRDSAMNRTQRVKSQLGKAQKNHHRRRGVDRFHQFLISDYLDRTHKTEDSARLVPVIRGASGLGTPAMAGAARVHVISPEPAETPSPAAAPPRSRPSSPPVPPGVATARGPKTPFTLRGVLRGFLMGALPAAALAALYKLLAG